MEPDAFLRSHPPWDRLSAGGLRRALERLEIVYAAREDTILRRTDPENHHLFVVRKGAVRLERDGLPVQQLEEGEPFGYPSLLAGGSPTTDAVADEGCLLYRFPGALFQALLEEKPFAEYFLTGLADRLRQAARVEGSRAKGFGGFAGDLSTPVADLLTRPPVFCEREATVAEAARIMTGQRVSSVLVPGRPPGEPHGILTDRDLRSRILAAGRPADTPALRVASRPLVTVAAHAPAFDALVSMLERRIHHLAVVDEGGPAPLDGRSGDDILGVLTDSDLLRHHLHSPLYVLGRIERIERPSHFSDYARQLASMVEVLFRGSLDAVEIGRIVSTVHDAATVRLIHLGQRELRDELGWGDPPCPWAWIVHGSEGRREQALLTDQDNAIVYRDETEEAARYFAELGRRVTRSLQRLGLPPCPGGFMADRWHGPLATWQTLFRGWIETPEPQALIDAANFFDHRPVWGDLDLSPLDETVRAAAGQRRFLAHMAKNALDFKPPIGMLRRIRKAAEGVDLKKGGIIPIVGLARLAALEAGSPARGTIDRLEAGRRHGVLSSEGAETLAEAFRFMLRLRLEHQLTARRRGRPLDNRVRMDALSPLEQRHLKDAFAAIREVQEVVEQRWGVGMLG